DMKAALLGVLALSACSQSTEPRIPMDLVIRSDAGNVVRSLSDVEREKVARWVLDESSEWTESDEFPPPTAVMVGAETFQLVIVDDVMVLCAHGIGCRERPAPVASLLDIIEW